MQRCSSHIASLEDIRSSEAIGMAAVKAGLDGQTGCMMTFVRESNMPYSYRISSVEASKAANSEKFFPRECRQVACGISAFDPSCGAGFPLHRPVAFCDVP